MGMLGHAIEMMIVPKNESPLVLNLWLDNEEYLELTKKSDLFANVSSTAELLKRIPYGFKHPFDEEEDMQDFLQEFDYAGEYGAFRRKAMKLNLQSIDAVVLMSTIEQEFRTYKFEYDWIKYTLSPARATTGTGMGQSALDVEKYLLSLINMDGEPLKESLASSVSAGHVKEEIAFDVEAFEQRMQRFGEQWLETYGDAVDKNAVISFSGNSFVLSGMEALGDEYRINIEEAITARGGVVRKNVSGKTDYLVVDPKWAGESKVKAAIEQRAKGNAIKIILGTDLIVAISSTNSKKENGTTTAERSAPMKSNSDMRIKGTVFEQYVGHDSEVIIPEGVTSIGDMAFSECSSLTSIVIPESVTSIGRWAFDGCSSLTSVVIPESVTSIGDSAFKDCSSLATLTAPGELGWDPYTLPVRKLIISDGSQMLPEWLKNFEDTLTEVVIPQSVTSIGDSAFRDCSSLTSLVIPESVTSIGDSAFRDCSSLTSLVIPESVTSIGDNAFEGCSSLTNLVIPNGVESLGCCIIYDCINLTCITAPLNLDFSGAPISKVIISKGATSIRDWCFCEWSDLTSVVIPEGVTSIGKCAFMGCSDLTSVVIPEGVTSIGDSAFEGCSSLTSVVIPESVISIGDCAFLDCKSLAGVVIPESVTSIGKDVFGTSAPEDTAMGNEVSTNVDDVDEEDGDIGPCLVIPEGVTTIEESAYWMAGEIISVEIPGSVTEIQDEAFYFCDGLTSIVIPEGVETIGRAVFAQCFNLENIYLPASLLQIGKDAFSTDCEKTVLHVYAGSYAEKYAVENGLRVNVRLTPEQEEETRRQQEAETRLQREREEQARKEAEEAQCQEVLRQQCEIEEQSLRAAEERERQEATVHKRQEELAAKCSRYDEISNAIMLQMQIIDQNKGWFGAQAKARKAAQEQLTILQSQLAREFPKGKP